ncbi:PLD nuclease N-terminal domain-containing protein [Streptomyces sp. NPDC059506]|uniref:PLD nuclease N-terminal domain-containing protein n=1 Tax=Streptomyces TaxID=1883 RepID=UPI000CC2D2C9|nr:MULTISPECIES: PLD nuclease N-terminal domain-containing protein [unclassified Streptomyces]MCZ2524037.1 PLD nuclease N-terminal domain-containing protein [Streptomyces sp. HB2AG]PLW71936.1 hypothetical protein C0036_15230 [Streptomyces sp. DJ]QMV22777.1 hypothetical protein GQS52_14485 [Streptomyces sp. SCUT-3]
MLRYLPFLLVLALWIYTFIDCLNTPEDQVRKLPKLAWVFIILLFGQVLIGPVAWLAVGRPRSSSRAYGARPREQRQWIAPDDNPEFLRSLGKEKDEEQESDEDGTGGTGGAGGAKG